MHNNNNNDNNNLIYIVTLKKSLGSAFTDRAKAGHSTQQNKKAKQSSQTETCPD